MDEHQIRTADEQDSLDRAVARCPHGRQDRGHRVARGSFDWHYETCTACGGERPEHDDDDNCGICQARDAGTGPGHGWAPAPEQVA